MSENKRNVFTGKQKGEGRIRIGQGDQNYQWDRSGNRSSSDLGEPMEKGLA